MFSRIRRLTALVATIAIVVAVSSCAESSRAVATGKGEIRGINAVATAPDISFLIEERPLGSMRYKDTSGYSNFDDLTYNFNFDMFLPRELDAIRVATHSLDVSADFQHTVVISGTIANPSTLSWEDPVREWAESETVFEAIFAHLASSIGAVDIYFAPPGTPPLLGAAIGSLANGARLAGMDFEDGEYELILTPQGDPATIIYQSVPIFSTPRTRATIAIFNPDPSITGDVAVNLITDSGASRPIPDVNFPSQLRMLHAAFGVENVDGYFNSDFANLVYSDIGFQGLSTYVDLAAVTTILTLTQVGNSGATIHEATIFVGPASRHTALLGGTLADPFVFRVEDEARPLETFPVIRLINMSVNTDFVNAYVLEAGTPIDDALLPSIIGLPSRFDTGFFATGEGLQELTLTLTIDTTPIATPLILDLANGDTVDIAIVDTVDPTVLELVLFDRQ